MNDNAFATWLSAEIRYRGWSHSELARQAKVSQTLVSKVISGTMAISCDFCIKVAQALGESPERVLRLAGILPPAEDQSDDPVIAYINDLLAIMPAHQRREAMRYIQFLHRLETSPNPDQVMPPQVAPDEYDDEPPGNSWNRQ